MSYTKGQWFLNEHNHVYAKRHYRLHAPFMNGEGEMVTDFYHGLIALPYPCEEGTQQGNAALIATAPELLETLHNLVDLASVRGRLDDYAATLTDARNLMIRAEGGK